MYLFVLLEMAGGGDIDGGDALALAFQGAVLDEALQEVAGVVFVEDEEVTQFAITQSAVLGEVFCQFFLHKGIVNGFIREVKSFGEGLAV